MVLAYTHALDTLGMFPVHLKMRGTNVVSCLFFGVKPTLLAQTQTETLTINTSLPHLEILVQNCVSSRGRLKVRKTEERGVELC